MHTIIKRDYHPLLFAELFAAFVEVVPMSLPNGSAYTALRSWVGDRPSGSDGAPPVHLPGPLVVRKWTEWSGREFGQHQYWTNYAAFANGATLRVEWNVTKRSAGIATLRYSNVSDVDGEFCLSPINMLGGVKVSLGDLFAHCGV